MNQASFILTSVMLGFGLAMDAFSVSVADGLHDSNMSSKRMHIIAGTFAFFQFLMPMIGWCCVHFIITYFKAVQPLIPWIGMLLLYYIGGNMIREGLSEQSETEQKVTPLTPRTLLVQAVATSIDALSVGFTIAEYGFPQALCASLIIAAVTYLVCLPGVMAGRKAGGKLTNKAPIIGGIILILIGTKIKFFP
ncbi:MAG: manganese efflux pump [Solobacterium sp.]|nr:manganese efflux pump [Solobacterium sp.]